MITDIAGKTFNAYRPWSSPPHLHRSNSRNSNTDNSAMTPTSNYKSKNLNVRYIDSDIMNNGKDIKYDDNNYDRDEFQLDSLSNNINRVSINRKTRSATDITTTSTTTTTTTTTIAHQRSSSAVAFHGITLNAAATTTTTTATTTTPIPTTITATTSTTTNKTDAIIAINNNHIFNNNSDGKVTKINQTKGSNNMKSSSNTTTHKGNRLPLLIKR